MAFSSLHLNHVMARAHLRLYLHPVAISAQAVSAEKMLHPVLLLMPLPVRTYSGGKASGVGPLLGQGIGVADG